MRSRLILPLLAALGLLGVAVCAAPAQQVTVTTPFHAVNDSFFEQFGTHWGFNYKGLNFSFGGPNMGMPQFGNFDPNAGISGGFGVQGGDFNGFFSFAAGQGYRQSLVSQAPSVTLTNGYPGSISDTSQSPFVVGVIPVVGGFVEGFPLAPRPLYTMGYPIPPMGRQFQMAPQGDSRVRAMMRQIAAEHAARAGDGSNDLLAGLPGGGAGGGPAPPRVPAPAVRSDPSFQKLAAAQSSSAGRAVPSVAEARRMHELEKATQNDEARVYYEKALGAEEGGKPGLAKVYYKMAVKRANGELRSRILARLKALSSADTPK